MNKVLTVSIAAYNVEKFIKKTLESLLVKGIEILEVLVEDDGGTDDTARIVKEYEKKYPGIIKFVHKENGGYGSTINKSIELAEGKYFKQLDGDDWYDSENFEKLLELLKNIDTDAVYTPYKKYFENRDEYVLKDYFDENSNGEYKADQIINKCTHSLEMYTMMYKTKILKDKKINLLTKCLYTDKEYAMYPMIYTETIYITHLPIYVYRYGRDEQSMSVNSKRKHYEEQIKVNKRCLDIIREQDDVMTEEKRKYMYNYVGLEAASTVGNFLIILPPSKENLKKIKLFEEYIYENNIQAYNEMHRLSRIAKILKKTNYNYLLYKLISLYKVKKMK